MGILFFILVFWGSARLRGDLSHCDRGPSCRSSIIYCPVFPSGRFPPRFLRHACSRWWVCGWCATAARPFATVPFSSKSDSVRNPQSYCCLAAGTLVARVSYLDRDLSKAGSGAGGVAGVLFEPALVFVVLIRTTLNSATTSPAVCTRSSSPGMSVASIAIIQRFTGWGLSAELSLQHRVTSLYPYPNAVGLYLAPIIPIIAYHALSVRRSLSGTGASHVRHTFIWGGAVSMMVLAIWFAQTEAAIVALLAVGVLGMIF